MVELTEVSFMETTKERVVSMFEEDLNFEQLKEVTHTF